jgi:ABC-type phosphate transport system ATPase subunit
MAARGSAVLLLDEPTSALDPVSEAQVYERQELAVRQTLFRKLLGDTGTSGQSLPSR